MSSAQEKMLLDIESEYQKLVADFTRVKSPNAAKLKENTTKELEDYLYGENSLTPSLFELRSQKYFTRRYVKDCLLKNELRVIPAREADGFRNQTDTEREWIVEAEAKHKFLMYLKGQGSAASHRIRALALHLKLKSGEETHHPRAKDLIAIGGKNFELAFNALNPLERAKKTPTKKEYELVVKELTDFPKARAIAEDEIKKP